MFIKFRFLGFVIPRIVFVVVHVSKYVEEIIPG